MRRKSWQDGLAVDTAEIMSGLNETVVRLTSENAVLSAALTESSRALSASLDQLTVLERENVKLRKMVAASVGIGGGQ